MTIPVVDVFAGPGGLGEGFSAFDPTGAVRTPFRIAISAEMEANAARTLKLRAFFRQFSPGDAPESYYEYVAGSRKVPWTDATRAEWERAGEEARQLTLGKQEDDAILRRHIRPLSKTDQPWILVGGPPCQAYSLVGRARNQGIAGYRAEEDSRHFLYQHYLQILNEFRPAAFVMENVKGILSSKVGGELMFPKILDDLQRAGGKRGHKYRIVPLVMSEGQNGETNAGKDFILRAEELGVPQARHRVVLLGLSEGVELPKNSLLQTSTSRCTVADAIAGLPALRSGVTDRNVSAWQETARSLLEEAAAATDDPKVSRALLRNARELRNADPGRGGKRMRKSATSDQVPRHLKKWLLDRRLDVILNHEVRGHMAADLVRYAYASAFAEVHGHSPRGATEFPAELAPKHKNWKSGKFVDRFKVQLAGSPSSTVTSHLSKDGHYFIHPDPAQLRSLSVREAARLQTFPDNYFFEGARGAQYRQVGNAVPPWMAMQIASVVYSCLRS